MRRISVLAILFLVLLRIAIGWQFLYEGLWKYDTLDTANPWTAKGYLANAEGPFRDHFRGMVGDFPGASDPDDLLWLDYDAVSGSWDRWAERFKAHYGLDAAQQKSLDEMLNGPPQWALPLPAIPDNVRDRLAGLAKARAANPTADLPDIKYETGQLILSGKTPLKTDEANTMYRWVSAVLTDRIEEGVVKETLAKADSSGQPVLDENGQPVRMDEGPARDFAARVFALHKTSQSGLGYKQKLAASLRGDPERSGVYKPADQPGFVTQPPPTPDESVELVRYGEIQKYKDELRTYLAAHDKAKMPHEFEHLARLKTKLEGLKRSAVGPVKTLDTELKEKARALLTSAQVALGPAPQEVTPLSTASQRSMWALLVIGALLVLGLCTRLAALAGAVLLLSFYLVVPPWPGVPEPAGVTEHALIVNKNLIEVIALLALAALPTGSWFGIDGIFRWMFGRKSSAGA